MVYIPAFLINKVYESGSLENTPEGFRFCFVNTMTPVEISGMRDITLTVDGNRYPVENIELSLGGKPVSLRSGELTENVKFGKESRLSISVIGDHLSEGKHVIKISFITNEFGGATLKVTDTLGKQKPAGLLERIGSFFSRKERKPAAPAKREPVVVEGELGGVPLDPDFSRLEAALNHVEADRVPLFEAEIELPIQEWFLGREIQCHEDVIEFYIRAGYDYVAVLPPFFTPRIMRTASDQGDPQEECDSERAWLVESEGLIKTLEDVERFPWPKAVDVDFSSFYDMAELLPPRMKILGMLVPAAIFGNTSQSMGLQNFSYALYDNVEVVEALFHIIGTSYLAIAKRLVEVPRLGAVFMSDDLAHTGGCLVSPKIYRKYVFPWYRKIGETLEEAGLPFIFHSDGDITEVLDDLWECGIKAIHPIEPQAMDIYELKKRYGDRFCIFGNIDLDYTLTRGTVEEVEQQVKEKIRRLAPGGGYGVAASNSIPDYVKPENYRAMVESVKKYGKYPISI